MVITYQELVDRVAAHGEIADSGQARRAVQAVVTVLAPQIDPGVREELRQALPPSLWSPPPEALTGRVEESGDVARQMGRELGCPPERGLHAARTVLAEIARSSPELGADLAGCLPEELAQWAADPIGAAGRADTGATGAPSRLDEQTLRSVRERLPDWQGDTHRLTRTVRLPHDRIPPLVARVERIGRELSHPAHHEVTDDGIAFTVGTASVDAVTTLDIELAERVEQAIGQTGSGG